MSASSVSFTKATFDFHGKTIGVIGTGKIGQAFIDLCLGFGMRVLAYDPYPVERSGVEYVELQIRERYLSDIVQRFLGQKGLVRGNDDIRHGDQPRKHIVLDNRVRKILVKQLRLLLIHIQTGRADPYRSGNALESARVL